MTSERWAEVERVLAAALLRPERERAAFVAAACAGDGGLRVEVESLLARETHADGFLEVPAAEWLDDPAAFVGRQFGAYRIDATLGSGGMGDVYRARDLSLDRDVAIKTL